MNRILKNMAVEEFWQPKGEGLKLSLLPGYRNNRDGYTEAKTEFVRNIVGLAKNIDEDL